jgi:hypothetical protein
MQVKVHPIEPTVYLFYETDGRVVLITFINAPGGDLSARDEPAAIIRIELTKLNNPNPGRFRTLAYYSLRYSLETPVETHDIKHFAT